MAADDAPDAKPKSLFEKIGVALPVALTALGTVFAGLSGSELQRAMLWRSNAAQDQSKATSQWSFAGFKRDRSLVCETAAAQLAAAGGRIGNPFATPGAGDPQARRWLAGDGPPKTPPTPVADARLQRLLDAVRTREPEAEVARQARAVPLEVVNAAIDAAEQFADATAASWDGTLDAARALAESSGERAASRAALYELEARRYKAESRLNQSVGYLYEARVRVTESLSERHLKKSYNFFYAMLAAQIGATVSSLALARQQRSVLWSVAGATGLVAIAIGAWVFLSDL